MELIGFRTADREAELVRPPQVLRPRSGSLLSSIPLVTTGPRTRQVAGAQTLVALALTRLSQGTVKNSNQDNGEEHF